MSSNVVIVTYPYVRLLVCVYILEVCSFSKQMVFLPRNAPTPSSSPPRKFGLLFCFLCVLNKSIPLTHSLARSAVPPTFMLKIYCMLGLWLSAYDSPMHNLPPPPQNIHKKVSLLGSRSHFGIDSLTSLSVFVRMFFHCQYAFQQEPYVCRACLQALIYKVLPVPRSSEALAVQIREEMREKPPHGPGRNQAPV